MKLKQLLGYSGFTVCLLAAPLALGAGASGEAIGFTCAGCHGTNGVSTGPAAPTMHRPMATYSTIATTRVRVRSTAVSTTPPRSRRASTTLFRNRKDFMGRRVGRN